MCLNAVGFFQTALLRVFLVLFSRPSEKAKVITELNFRGDVLNLGQENITPQGSNFD